MIIKWQLESKILKFETALTLSLLNRPKPPLGYGTKLTDSIFLKQENHVSISVLKQSLIVSLRL